MKYRFARSIYQRLFTPLKTEVGAAGSNASPNGRTDRTHVYYLFFTEVETVNVKLAVEIGASWVCIGSSLPEKYYCHFGFKLWSIYLSEEGAGM